MNFRRDSRWAPHLQPFGELEMDALRRLAGNLERTTDWSGWLDTLPVIQGVQEMLAEIGKQHLRMSALIPYLAQVCWKPRSSLRTEEERLPVERARRIPERAAAVLLAHPEDWAGRTLRSVQAARVLSTVVEDDWGIYENRLAVQLLHRLLGWYTQNLDWLRRTERMEREASDFSGDTGGNHWRSHRMFNLWGALVEDSEISRRTTRLRCSLEREHLRLLGLLDAPLCRHLKAPGEGTLSLRPTNVLSHDPTYRKVADLWRIWMAASSRSRESEQEKAQRQEQASQDFRTFALLLVMRALSSLGCHPESTPHLTPAEGELLLDGPCGVWNVRWSAGEISLGVDSSCLRILALPGLLNGDRAAGWWSSDQVKSLSGDTFLLLMGAPVLAQSPALDSKTSRALCGWSWPRVQLVSPWSLDSVERVARVLRGWEVEQRIRWKFDPHPLHSSVDIGAPWLVSGQRVGLRYPPGKEEYLEAVSWLERQQIPEKNSRQEHRKNDLWKRKKQDLELIQAELARCEKHLFGAWRSCPVCADERSSAEALDTGKGGPAWRCRCQACGSEWGVLRCGSCKRTFPVLKPPSFAGYSEQELAPWGSDQRWGRDIWSEPRLTPRGLDIPCSCCQGERQVRE